MNIPFPVAVELTSILDKMVCKAVVARDVRIALCNAIHHGRCDASCLGDVVKYVYLHAPCSVHGALKAAGLRTQAVMLDAVVLGAGKEEGDGVGSDRGELHLISDSLAAACQPASVFVSGLICVPRLAQCKS